MKNTETREMLVVNFDCLSAIPLHDSAVVYPFDLFLECADNADPDKADEEYGKIVQKAIAWRKDNIESNYTKESPVWCTPVSAFAKLENVGFPQYEGQSGLFGELETGLRVLSRQF